ncbi:hypothetical protein [Noviherbaspirillum pedocola]|uniref:Uncharacterized protein n=1 Tax=Noviherbaspirillum pedocola TaxID=2801341 RepID=A0A934T4A3_9BURK|nr:hypothetical protein [Noviherbaspirillum pedocola]MBK4739208.1 hypothetical protein [Noviherbaspirillum pedocola]
MRAVTQKELDALVLAAETVRHEGARLSQLAINVNTVTLGMVADGRPADAVVFGAGAVEAIEAEKNRMYADFERAAFNFTGEPRLPGEDAEGYFYRIASMTEAETLLSPIRNGLRLELWRKH